MHYEGNIIRPPSEANSILLQVTLGCSRNKCTFCGTYKNQTFKIKSDKIIEEDIKFAFNNFKYQNRVFLCDGDALIIPQKKLIKILKKIKTHLPWVKRVSTYANAKSLKSKTVNELKKLRKLGLKILYFGLETGDDRTLKIIKKGTFFSQITKVCQKTKLSKIKISITILLGIAGKSRSLIHSKKTGEILSLIDPEYVGALSLIIIPGTYIYKKYKQGNFTLIEPIEMLYELKNIIDKTHLSDGLFHANHASNYLPIRANMPKDKLKILKKIDKALSGKSSLKPEYLRAL